MQQYPPHLPPPSCNVEHHRLQQRLASLAFVVLFGLLAGVTGAAVFMGWIWPYSTEGNVWFFNHEQGSGVLRVSPVEARLSESIFTLYAKQSMVGTVGYFDPNDKLGDAIVGLSSGWLVAYVPGVVPSKDWRLVSADGEVYLPERLQTDQRTGLTFIKIAQPTDGPLNQFKVAVFDEAKAYGSASVLANGGWTDLELGGPVALTNSSHLDLSPLRRFSSLTTIAKGAVVINDAGAVVGFGDGSTLLSAAKIATVLPQLEELRSLVYSSFGVEGWFSDERPLAVGGERKEGFLVTKVASAKSLLKKGDIILEVDGRAVTFDSIWYTSMSKGTMATYRLKVLRSGKEIELPVSLITL